MLTLSLKYASPSCWMLSSASVYVIPAAVPARERFWLFKRATSNASPGERGGREGEREGVRDDSNMVNWRYLASSGMMKFWVKLLFKRDSSVRTACPSIMLAAPRVDQVSWVSKVPLLIPISGSDVSGAVNCASVGSLSPERKRLSICRLSRDGSLRTPGLNVVFIKS